MSIITKRIRITQQEEWKNDLEATERLLRIVRAKLRDSPHPIQTELLNDLEAMSLKMKAMLMEALARFPARSRGKRRAAQLTRPRVAAAATSSLELPA